MLQGNEWKALFHCILVIFSQQNETYVYIYIYRLFDGQGLACLTENSQIFLNMSDT